MQFSPQTGRLSKVVAAAVLSCWALGVAAAGPAAEKGAPTVAEAQRFVKAAEARLAALNIRAGRAGWVAENFITDDTELIKAQADEELLKVAGEVALAARRYNGLKLPTDTARKLKMMQLTRMLADDAERERLTRLAAALTGAYGKAKYCPPKAADGKEAACMDIGAVEQLMAESRDPAKLKDAWLGWHAQAKAYRKDYADFVALSNKGARTMGFADVGALWRSNYDMPPEAFAADMARTWSQVKPLYDSLHTYVRHKLRQAYGPAAVPASGPIPAHLLGNPWSQSWENVFPLVRPAAKAGDYDMNRVLAQRNTTAK